MSENKLDWQVPEFRVIANAAEATSDGSGICSDGFGGTAS